MKNQKEFGAGDQAIVVAIGGEFLIGSGFECEIPDTGFSESDDSAISVGR